MPIQLNTHHREDFFTMGDEDQHLPAGFYKVGVEKNYIIGVILGTFLFPLKVCRSAINNTCQRVKVRFDGSNANMIVPISDDDALNLQFFNAFPKKNIRYAEIAEPEEFN